MKISSRCEYACRAVLELASRETQPEPLTAVAIAERRHIPEKYLVHILLQLKNAGIVRSIRGAQGGYLLARPAIDITLLDLVEAIDGPILAPIPAGNGEQDGLETTWRMVAKEIEHVLRGLTVHDILTSARTASMYYI